VPGFSEDPSGPDSIYLTGCDLLDIALSYTIKSEFVSDQEWPKKLKQRLQALIWMYFEGSKEDTVRPSTIKRKLQALHNKAQAFSDSFEHSLADPYIKDALRRAAETDGELPDLDVAQLIVEINRPLDQIRSARREIRWLASVIAAAHQQSVAETPKAGGNRDDSPRHTFVREIDAFYRETAANPTNPYCDGASEQYKGELLHLLHVCMSYIDVYLAHSGLLSLWERAVGRNA
jgi:hypothetical protein